MCIFKSDISQIFILFLPEKLQKVFESNITFIFRVWIQRFLDLFCSNLISCDCLIDFTKVRFSTVTYYIAFIPRRKLSCVICVYFKPGFLEFIDQEFRKIVIVLKIYIKVLKRRKHIKSIF